MIRTQIQIEEDQIEWLRSESMARGVSISHLIRESINLYRADQRRFPEGKKAKALAAVGRFSSSFSDVSKRHDAHLADALGEETGYGK